LASDRDIREQLVGYFQSMVDDAAAKRRKFPSKPKIQALIAAEAGVDRGLVAVSSAAGGTKQTHNRLGQAAQLRATELTVLVLGSEDSIDASVDYVVEAMSGRKAAKPVGPVAFALPTPGGGFQMELVEGRATKASRLLRSVFDIAPTDPRSPLIPSLPDGAPLWLLMSSARSDYGDRDGVCYHFPKTIPNGKNITAGDVVVVARTKGSTEPDAGAIFGLGRVGRRTNAMDGSHAYAYFDRYLAIEPAIPLEELGDPRTNVNSIVGLDQAWVLSLMKSAGILDIEDLSVPITALSLDDLTSQIVSDRLIFDSSVIQSALVAIRAGKHIMLTGAPGTGKTSLALSIAAAAHAAAICNEALLTTGTADWSAADTVGSYRLTRDQQLRFHPGHVTVAIENDRWLIIDELNRADVDKAIGQFFTVLSDQAVTLPFEEHDDEAGVDSPISIVPPGQIPPIDTVPKRITPNWRLIATMNDRDRDLLFDMSEALMRRFAIIAIPTPTSALWQQILHAVGGTGRAEWDAGLSALVNSPELTARPLGAAVLLDASRHLREIVHLHEELDTSVDLVAAFQKVLDIYIVPQLRTLSESVSLEASSFLAFAPALASDDGPPTTA
jgi:MoxR-like ATPase